MLSNKKKYRNFSEAFDYCWNHISQRDLYDAQQKKIQSLIKKIKDSNIDIIPLVDKFNKVKDIIFVKDFNKDVLDAETKTDIITHYPSAKFFIGKISHFFGELEPNLFFKAYHAKYYKENTGNRIKGDFKITSIYSKKGRNYEYLYYDDDGSTGPTNEAEVKSPEDFKEYAFSVLGKAFGDKFDEEKAQEVVDGLLDKHGDDYGAAVGALQSSLG